MMEDESWERRRLGKHCYASLLIIHWDKGDLLLVQNTRLPDQPLSWVKCKDHLCGWTPGTFLMEQVLASIRII